MEKLDVFKKRLDRIGVKVKFAANYPWVYLWEINGKRVTETFYANHGFTVGFLPNDRPFHFTDLKKIFEIIRKYCKK